MGLMMGLMGLMIDVKLMVQPISLAPLIQLMGLMMGLMGLMIGLMDSDLSSTRLSLT